LNGYWKHVLVGVAIIVFGAVGLEFRGVPRAIAENGAHIDKHCEKIEEAKKTVEEHQERDRKDREAVLVLQTDIGWIRKGQEQNAAALKQILTAVNGD